MAAVSRTSVARALADTSDPGHTAALIASRCQGSGLDPRGYAGMYGAALTLGQPLLPAGAGWCSDRDLVDAIADLQDTLAARQARLRIAQAETRAALARAQRQAARDRHLFGQVGAETRIVLADCRTALEVLGEAAGRLRHAVSRIGAVPGELGEVYEAVYRLVRAGRVLPHNGRWLTGEEV
ncbi:MAG TPA: hypothetical protein VIS29_20680 [Streptomyces sp.]